MHNEELSSYLARLAHPARKAYATAYAEHVLNGAAEPEVPLSVDAETATKIQRKVTKYASASSKPEVLQAPVISEGLVHLPDALRAYAAERGDTELLGLVDAFTALPQPQGEQEKLSDYYEPETVPAFVETANVDVLDITDLEPSLARALALKLVMWNGRGKVYSRRNGRRYLSRDIRRMDLNDATVQALPNYPDLITVVRERNITRA